MHEALFKGRKGKAPSEAPVCGIIFDSFGHIVSYCHSRVKVDMVCNRHAEMVHLQATMHIIGIWGLLHYTLYCMLEQCAMYLWAALLARVWRVEVWVADRPCRC